MSIYEKNNLFYGEENKTIFKQYINAYRAANNLEKVVKINIKILLSTEYYAMTNLISDLN